jgi:hypothetical protein
VYVDVPPSGTRENRRAFERAVNHRSCGRCQCPAAQPGRGNSSLCKLQIDLLFSFSLGLPASPGRVNNLNGGGGVKRITAVLGLFVAGSFAGSALAQTGVIHACVAFPNGEMRMVSNETSCRKGEELVSWNSQGPSQPVSVVLRQFQQTVTLEPGENKSIAALCLLGETSLSGGPSFIPGPPIFVAWSTVVFDGGPLTGWQVAFQNGGTEAITVTPRTAVLCTPGSMALQ